MTHKLHYKPFGHPSPSQPANGRYPAAMVAEVRQQALDVVPLNAAQHKAPRHARSHGAVAREHTGKLGPRSPQLQQDGPKLRVDGHRSPSVPLGMNQHLPRLPVDAGQREGCFGNAPALPYAKEEADGHPPLCNGQMALLAGEMLANDSFFLGGYFGLLLGLVCREFQFQQGIGGDESTLPGLLHDALQHHHFSACCVDFGPVLLAAIVLAPCKIAHGRPVRHVGGLQGVNAAEVGPQEAPANEGCLFAVVGHGQDGVYPVLHPSVPVGALGGRFAAPSPALHACVVVCLFPAQGIVLALAAALHLPARATAIPHPIKRASLALVDTECGHEGCVTECNSGAIQNRALRGELGAKRSLQAHLYFVKAYLGAIAPYEAGNASVTVSQNG